MHGQRRSSFMTTLQNHNSQNKRIPDKNFKAKGCRVKTLSRKKKNNMKLKKNFVLGYSFAVLLSILCLSTFSASCGAGELTRPKAEELINQSADFKGHYQIEYTQGDEKYNDGLLEVISADETKEQAVARKTKQYMELNPQIAVLNHYGMVTPNVVPREEKPPARVYYSNPAFWHFQEKYTGSDRADEFWRKLGLEPNKETFPLAKRELIEVTGLIKQGDQQFTAEFKWRWLPNEIGRAMDSTTDEYKALPADLQDFLSGDKIPAGEYRAHDWRINWKFEKQGRAIFQKYDNGWRLTSISGL